MKKLLAAVAMLAVTINASADGYINASDLRDRLRLLDTMFKTNKGQPADFSNAGIGMGYVLAISDANDGTLTCAPSNAKDEQLAATVLKFIDDNPTMWNLPAAWVTGLALHEAYPCHDKK